MFSRSYVFKWWCFFIVMLVFRGVVMRDVRATMLSVGWCSWLADQPSYHLSYHHPLAQSFIIKHPSACFFCSSPISFCIWDGLHHFQDFPLPETNNLKIVRASKRASSPKHHCSGTFAVSFRACSCFVVRQSIFQCVKSWALHCYLSLSV